MKFKLQQNRPLAPKIALDFSVFRCMNFDQALAQNLAQPYMSKTTPSLVPNLAPNLAPNLMLGLAPSLAPNTNSGGLRLKHLFSYNFTYEPCH